MSAKPYSYNEQKRKKDDASVADVLAAANRKLRRAYARELKRGGTPMEALRRVILNRKARA
jgi:hypothetical protein